MVIEMHSEDINSDKYYNKIPKRLQDIIPEFKSMWDEEDVYQMLFEFGEFLLENFENDKVCANCFRFINEALTVGGKKTEDAIFLEVLHLIYPEPDLISKARNKISPSLVDIFDKGYRDFYS